MRELQLRKLEASIAEIPRSLDSLAIEFHKKLQKSERVVELWAKQLSDANFIKLWRWLNRQELRTAELMQELETANDTETWLEALNMADFILMTWRALDNLQQTAEERAQLRQVWNESNSPSI